MFKRFRSLHMLIGFTLLLFRCMFNRINIAKLGNWRFWWPYTQAFKEITLFLWFFWSSFFCLNGLNDDFKGQSLNFCQSSRILSYFIGWTIWFWLIIHEEIPCSVYLKARWWCIMVFERTKKFVQSVYFALLIVGNKKVTYRSTNWPVSWTRTRNLRAI